MKNYAIAVMMAMLIMPVTWMPEAYAGDMPCRLWITGHDYYDVVDSDGNPRNNPDETLYPGDVFSYVFRYGFGSGCIGPRVHPVVSHGSIEAYGTSPSGRAEAEIGDTNDCHGGGGKGATGYGGDDSWSRSAPKDCGHLSMKISAKERHCGENGCRYITKIRSATITPMTIAPVVEVQLYEHILEDPDKYIAANEDLTNYVWDPVAIEHRADFEYLKDREGTITFDYIRTFAPLVEEGGFECDYTCSQNLVVKGGIDAATGTGFLPYPLDAENGAGMYAYTAPSLGQIGLQNINYHVTVLNEERMINVHHNSTDQLIVTYEPEYDWYEYPVLADGGKYAYDDRQGILMKYHGSHGSGAGDDGKLHDDRRSKINAFYQNTTAYSESEFYEPILIPDRLEWDSIDHVEEAGDEDWVTTDGEHAMFLREGYGILRLNQTISDVMLAEENVNKWYFNATIDNSITSDEWAGYDSFENYNYTYQYPHTPFATWFNMSAHSHTGEVKDASLTVNALPYNVTYSSGVPEITDGNLVIMLDDYLFQKTLYDTEDEIFAIGVVNETYFMNNSATGTGEMGMWMNKTGLEFIDFEIGGVPNIMNMSRYLALDLESETAVNMTAGDKELSRILLIEYQYPFSEIFVLGGNSGQEELIEIRRVGNDYTVLVGFDAPEYFGEIATISIDGKETNYRTFCDSRNCTFTTGINSTIQITNVWGASITAHVNATDLIKADDPAETFENTQDYLIYVGTAALVVWLIYWSLKRLMTQRQEE